MSQSLDKATRTKETLIRELGEIHALIETSHQALKYQAGCEAWCIEGVLSLAADKLFLRIEEEKKDLKTLEIKQQGGES